MRFSFGYIYRFIIGIIFILVLPVMGVVYVSNAQETGTAIQISPDEEPTHLPVPEENENEKSKNMTKKWEAALRSGNPEDCLELEVDLIIQDCKQAIKNNKTTDLAVQKQDYSLCQDMQALNLQQTCFRKVDEALLQKPTVSIQVCKKLRISGIKDICWEKFARQIAQKMAVQEQDIYFCSLVPDTLTCYTKVFTSIAQKKNNKELCQLIQFARRVNADIDEASVQKNIDSCVKAVQ